MKAVAVGNRARPLLVMVFLVLFLASSSETASAHYLSNNNGAYEYFGVQRNVKGYGYAGIHHITGTSDAPSTSRVRTGPATSPRRVDAIGVRAAVEYRAT
jgi:hypothetical protein